MLPRAFVHSSIHSRQLIRLCCVMYFVTKLSKHIEMKATLVKATGEL